MAKIKLVIADTDESYLKSLADYLSSKYGDKFQLSYFTQYTYLSDYMTHKANEMDILLICPSLFKELPKLTEKRKVILLTEESIEESHLEYAFIRKYQSGDEIANCIMNHFINGNPEKALNGSGTKEAMIIGAFSPAGGVGKTCISIAAAALSQLSGKASFYLNLEDSTTLPLLFDCTNKQNLSHLFYYLKEKPKNLDLRIETAVTTDPILNIDYFCPPECAKEWDEVEASELLMLINKLKYSGQYDRIFIDMSSCIDIRNMAVLNHCDKLIIIIEDEISKIKLETFIHELDDDIKQFILNKMVLVLNKYTSQDINQVLEMPVACRIPLETILFTPYQDRWLIRLNNSFGQAIKLLADCYL